MRKIIDRLLGRDGTGERSGVVWHTQGSGKSLTMVFAVRRMRTTPGLSDYKVIMVNDRIDLEKQLKETAELTGEPVRRIKFGGDEMRRYLSTDTSDLNMVMVHKFQEEDEPLLPGTESAAGRVLPFGRPAGRRRTAQRLRYAIGDDLKRLPGPPRRAAQGVQGLRGHQPLREDRALHRRGAPHAVQRPGRQPVRRLPQRVAGRVLRHAADHRAPRRAAHRRPLRQLHRPLQADGLGDRRRHPAHPVHRQDRAHRHPLPQPVRAQVRGPVRRPHAGGAVRDQAQVRHLRRHPGGRAPHRGHRRGHRRALHHPHPARRLQGAGGGQLAAGRRALPALHRPGAGSVAGASARPARRRAR